MTLVTFRIGSLWGSLPSGGHYFQGFVIFGEQKMLTFFFNYFLKKKFLLVHSCHLMKNSMGFVLTWSCGFMTKVTVISVTQKQNSEHAGTWCGCLKKFLLVEIESFCLCH